MVKSDKQRENHFAQRNTVVQNVANASSDIAKTLFVKQEKESLIALIKVNQDLGLVGEALELRDRVLELINQEKKLKKIIIPDLGVPDNVVVDASPTYDVSSNTDTNLSDDED